MTVPSVEALCRVGIARHDRGEQAQALAALRRAASINPQDARALTGLACVLDTMGDWLIGLRHHTRAFVACPTPAAAVNLAMALLLHGRFQDGWDLFEGRFVLSSWSGMVSRDSLLRHAGRRLRPGVALAGQRIVVFTEQGFGDALQFVRYVPLLGAAGARVTLVCPAALHRLFAALPGVERVLAPPTAGVSLNLDALPHDWHVAAMSLPWVFGTTLDSVPSVTPYLRPSPEAIAAWRARLPDDGPLKVGLVWAGNPRLHHLTDRQRSLPPERLGVLAGIGGLRFVSVQKGDAGQPPAGLALLDPMAGVTDFADTAALIANLDLVVTVDTSVVHLAGALGKPVWLLSRFDGCWRWLLEREDSPWYPSLRVFRQRAPGDWDSVLERVAVELAAVARRCPRWSGADVRA
ncbi:glycosyltransferase family 9 protein [Azospirillum sp. SYSU D00513]|uniref:glycosyltransferase family 9 protein n=1 Tax=Azospirillum sp. SYSU D00513 TaxID=2812561 RepID=UPI001A978CE2|nr:glycosyltransferase family 9 protein [Azospirillum sp. SYSU D00513]